MGAPIDFRQISFWYKQLFGEGKQAFDPKIKKLFYFILF